MWQIVPYFVHGFSGSKSHKGNYCKIKLWFEIQRDTNAKNSHICLREHDVTVRQWDRFEKKGDLCDRHATFDVNECSSFANLMCYAEVHGMISILNLIIPSIKIDMI